MICVVKACLLRYSSDGGRNGSLIAMISLKKQSSSSSVALLRTLRRILMTDTSTHRVDFPPWIELRVRLRIVWHMPMRKSLACTCFTWINFHHLFSHLRLTNERNDELRRWKTIYFISLNLGKISKELKLCQHEIFSAWRILHFQAGIYRFNWFPFSKATLKSRPTGGGTKKKENL